MKKIILFCGLMLLLGFAVLAAVWPTPSPVVYEPPTFDNARLQTEAVPPPVKDTRPEAIDAYFRERSMPLEGYGAEFVKYADENEIDWRLLAAIAVRESSGGKHACGNNPFGWGSCGKGFDFSSIGYGIYAVSTHLGGNAAGTQHYYAGKDTRGILNTYNPESIVPGYANQVIAIMNAIGPE